MWFIIFINTSVKTECLLIWICFDMTVQKSNSLYFWIDGVFIGSLHINHGRNNCFLKNEIVPMPSCRFLIITHLSLLGLFSTCYRWKISRFINTHIHATKNWWYQYCKGFIPSDIYYIKNFHTAEIHCYIFRQLD